MSRKLKTFQILQELSDNIPSYEAVTWLATPNKNLDGKTPHEMIGLGRVERVRGELYKFIKLYKERKKPRSNRSK